MKDGPPVVQIIADIEGSRKAERISDKRLAIEDWMLESELKISRTLYPSDVSKAVARTMAGASLSLTRDDGEMNAIVAPGSNALGIRAEDIAVIAVIA